jgi:hypothetical protein
LTVCTDCQVFAIIEIALNAAGLLPQDNRPVEANGGPTSSGSAGWIRMLQAAVDSGRLPPALAVGVGQIAARLLALAGPESRPSLLYGDAQQNNFVSTAAGAVVIDAAPASVTRWPT